MPRSVGPWLCGPYGDFPWTGRCENRISLLRFSAPVQTDPRTRPASYTICTVSPSWRWSSQGVVLTTHLYLAPTSLSIVGSLAAVAEKWKARAWPVFSFQVLIFVLGTRLLGFIQSTSGFSGWPKPGAGGSFYSYLTPGRLRRRPGYVVRQSFFFGLLHF